MSTHILRIDTSLFSEHGVSSQLNQTLVEQLAAHIGDAPVTHRDLAK